MRFVVWLTALTLLSTGCGGDDERAFGCADLIEVLPELSGGYPVPRPGGASATFDRFDAPEEIRADRAIVAQAQARALATLRDAGVETGKGMTGYSSEDLELIAKTSKAFAQPAVVDAVGRIASWVEGRCPEG